MQPRLILASASPRRKQLLSQIGVSFSVQSADIDEAPIKGESPSEYVKRLAIEKASAVYQKINSPNTWVLGSDTSVILNNEIFGKPVDKSNAIEMLFRLSGETHQVLTSVALIGGSTNCIVNESNVTFAKLTSSEIEVYWETGEPLGKAGAYAIQGVAAAFIKHLEGSFSGVMGLPLFETTQLLKQQHLMPTVNTY
jgi:septum formation protein